mmetsp:Transcript_42532/g.112225  ORF Transcript_42532/g.112225 Transcript_42532/m.112225 type:complete len:327 (-) Transcript_42532:468-1448(-)
MRVLLQAPSTHVKHQSHVRIRPFKLLQEFDHVLLLHPLLEVRPRNASGWRPRLMHQTSVQPLHQLHLVTLFTFMFLGRGRAVVRDKHVLHHHRRQEVENQEVRDEGEERQEPHRGRDEETHKEARLHHLMHLLVLIVIQKIVLAGHENRAHVLGPRHGHDLEQTDGANGQGLEELAYIIMPRRIMSDENRSATTTYVEHDGHQHHRPAQLRWHRHEALHQHVERLESPCEPNHAQDLQELNSFFAMNVIPVHKRGDDQDQLKDTHGGNEQCKLVVPRRKKACPTVGEDLEHDFDKVHKDEHAIHDEPDVMFKRRRGIDLSANDHSI